MGLNPVRKDTLDNGLVVLAQEDFRAPIVAYHTWYGVGSRHERPGRTGMAHLFEHLMFKETANLKEGEFDRKMEAVGARTNAATWVDWTFYYEKLPSHAAKLAFELEADRMENMTLGPDQLSSERQVVMNERRLRVDNDPEGKMYEILYAARYGRNHPYGWPTIGWMEDIEAITLEDCHAFYETYYAPNNATVVVTGAMKAEDIFEMAHNHYGHLPAFELPEEKWVSPHSDSPEKVEITLSLSSERLLMGALSPGIGDPDMPAWEILNEVLLNSESSRAHQDLLYEKELASGVSGWLSGFRYPGMLHLDITMKPGVVAEKALEILDGHIRDLAEKGPSQEEMDRALAKLEGDFHRQRLSAGGLAHALGLYACTLGDHGLLETVLPRLKAVSAEDVRQAAKKLQDPSRRTTLLVRQGEEGTE